MPKQPGRQHVLDHLSEYLARDPDAAVDFARQLRRLEDDAGDRAAAIRARALLRTERAA